MATIKRHSVLIAAMEQPALLNPLLVAVMAMLAQRLPVVAIPEQRLIPAMRPDVVNHGRWDNLPDGEVKCAPRIFAEKCESRSLPAASVAALC